MCNKCEGKGWVETFYGAANSWTPSIQQCPHRCNISGYSEEVQRRLSPGHVTQTPVLMTRNETPVAKIIQLRSVQ